MEGADELHASRQGIETVSSADYWCKVCPGLHIGDAEFQNKFQLRQGTVANDSSCADVRRRLVDEGFAKFTPDQITWSVDVEKLANGVLSLERHGWPATFIAMFDEAWIMAADARQIMSRATGNEMCMDIVGFLVDPRRTKGFSPHRDRQPEDWMPRGIPESVSATFRNDGMAKYVTLWAALTDANSENSCLHFVPKIYDPGYVAGDPEDADPMQRCFADKSAFQNIRCQNVSAGGCTFHTHRTIHWGNRGSPLYHGRPRIALSFGFSCHDFEPPYFSPKHLPFPAVDLRLALVSAQVLNYATLAAGDGEGWIALAGTMSACSSSTLNMLHKLFLRRKKAFHPSYCKEIAKKFVVVSLDLGRSGSSNAKVGEKKTDSLNKDPCAKTQSSKCPNEDESDDEEDEALKAMLSAEADTGEILFHDDFDMMETDSFAEAGLLADKRSNRKRKARQKGRSVTNVSASNATTSSRRKKRRSA